jgi:hypothetical protein
VVNVIASARVSLPDQIPCGQMQQNGVRVYLWRSRLRSQLAQRFAANDFQLVLGFLKHLQQSSRLVSVGDVKRIQGPTIGSKDVGMDGAHREFRRIFSLVLFIGLVKLLEYLAIGSLLLGVD